MNSTDRGIMRRARRLNPERQVLKTWLSYQSHPNRLADSWEHAQYKRALIKAFKRGVKFGRTGT